MIKRLATLFGALLLAFPLLSASPERPDPTLTPGEILNVTREQVCTPGYAKKVRHVTAQMKRAVFKRYGVKYVKGKYAVDHAIPLCMGGRNNIRNLWPQPYEQSLEKDRVEVFLCHEVCEGRLALKDAQREVMHWEEVKVPRRRTKRPDANKRPR